MPDGVMWWALFQPVMASVLRIALIVVLVLVLRQVAQRVIPRTLILAMRAERVEDGALLSPEEQARRTETLSHVLLRTIDVLLLVIGGFMLLAELGLDIAPVLAGAGVAGIAIGFGAQTLVRDILSGLFVLLENQYTRGDVVRIADMDGMVEAVNLRRTVLRDLDGVVHSIPNGEVRVASNRTRGWSGVNLNVTVGYGEDLDRVCQVLDRIGAAMSEDEEWGPLIVEQLHVMRINSFEESGIAIKVVGRTQPMKQWDVAGELRRRIKREFNAEGIEIPFPHRVVIHRSDTVPSRLRPAEDPRAAGGDAE